MTKIVYALKPGAPPMSKMKIRMSLRRTYVPSPTRNDGFNIPEGSYAPVYEGYEGVKDLLGAMQYDADSLVDGNYEPTELFDGSEEVIWELVDEDGNVWSTGQETITAEDL